MGLQFGKDGGQSGCMRCAKAKNTAHRNPNVTYRGKEGAWNQHQQDQTSLSIVLQLPSPLRLLQIPVSLHDYLTFLGPAISFFN
jgi:hypothetical protein